MPNIFGLVLVEQIFTDLTNSKLKVDFGAMTSMSENKDFWQKLRGLGTILQYYYGNIKTSVWWSVSIYKVSSDLIQ